MVSLREIAIPTILCALGSCNSPAVLEEEADLGIVEIAEGEGESNEFDNDLARLRELAAEEITEEGLCGLVPEIHEAIKDVFLGHRWVKLFEEEEPTQNGLRISDKFGIEGLSYSDVHLTCVEGDSLQRCYSDAANASRAPRASFGLPVPLSDQEDLSTSFTNPNRTSVSLIIADTERAGTSQDFYASMERIGESGSRDLSFARCPDFDIEAEHKRREEFRAFVRDILER